MIGRLVGRYRIDAELGRGGMGVVYRGTQVNLDRTVAIKMLPEHLADDDNRERFRREALTLARLAHPNIIHIYDVEELEGSSFIVMEHVGGGSLADLLVESGSLPPARAIEIVAPILSALQAAHLAGVVHRDIKPDNILFTNGGRPKLTDFGIAHLRDSGSRTRTGVMLGTPYYMSPEQAQGRKVTAGADLYAVGVVLYEMLGGRVPFLGHDPFSVALQHVQGTAAPLGELREGLPAALCATVHRALEKDPYARFGSAAAMQDALETGPWAPLRTSDPGSSGGRRPPARRADIETVEPDVTRELTLQPPPAAPPAVERVDVARASEAARAGDAGRAGDGAGVGAAVRTDDAASAGAPPAAQTPTPESGAHPRHIGAPLRPADSSAPAAAARAAVARGVSVSNRAATAVARGAEASGRAAAAVTRSAARRIGHLLGRPAWRGFPMAFWLGLGALALALLWPGVRAALDAGTPGSTFARSLEDGAAGATPAAGDREGPASPAVPVVEPGGAGAGGPGPGGGGPFGTPRGQAHSAAPALSPREVAELAALGSGRTADAGDDASPGNDAPSGDDRQPADDGQPGDDRLDPADSADDAPLEESVGAAQPDGAPPLTPDAERAAHGQIHAIIERQRQAVERADRELFLRDMHPSVHAEASRIFDDGSAGARDIRSTIADVEIDLLDPDHAFVTFRVDVTFTVRADGRTMRESTTEEWDVVRENGRWLILTWN